MEKDLDASAMVVDKEIKDDDHLPMFNLEMEITHLDVSTIVYWR